MKIAVGSTNPTKINAVKIAFGKVFPEETIEVVSMKVDSGIPDQPKGHLQTIQGAKNRAKAVLSESDADYGVGEEGGMQELDGQWFETGWCVVINRQGQTGIGSSIHMEVPNKLMRHIHKGQELGVATDIEFATIDAGKNAGFFGLMTNGHIDRTNAYVDAVITALSRFLHPQLF